MTFDYHALKERLAIDKHNLDDVIMEQPGLFYDVSEQLTIALAERDAAKENLEIVNAELDSKWRKNLQSQAKLTEKVISNHVMQDPDHEAAFTEYLTFKSKADRLQALKDAFQQRSYMLKSLVALYTANYYEDSAMKPSRAQEVSHYAANRTRIALARSAKNGKV